MVAENKTHCITLIRRNGEKLSCFGSKGVRSRSAKISSWSIAALNPVPVAPAWPVL